MSGDDTFTPRCEPDAGDTVVTIVSLSRSAHCAHLRDVVAGLEIVCADHAEYPSAFLILVLEETRAAEEIEPLDDRLDTGAVVAGFGRELGVELQFQECFWVTPTDDLCGAVGRHARSVPPVSERV